jgi:hypothetical protein
LIGETGAQGIQGEVGQTGSQGDTGVGAQGATGLQGAQGVTGLIGETGAQGLQGDTGLQGAVGETGAQGETGVGPQGVTGLGGATGPGGATGSANQTANWTVYIDGSLEARVYPFQIRVPSDWSNVVFKQAFAYAGSGPVGATGRIDVLQNGTSLFTGGDGDKLIIPDGGLTGASAAVNAPVTGGRILSVEVEVAGTTPASNVSVQIIVSKDD